MNNPYKVGQRISVENPVDGTPDYGTIVYIEEEELTWVYIVSDVDKNNIRRDPKFPEAYWQIRAANSPALSAI